MPRWLLNRASLSAMNPVSCSGDDRRDPSKAKVWFFIKEPWSGWEFSVCLCRMNAAIQERCRINMAFVSRIGTSRHDGLRVVWDQALCVGVWQWLRCVYRPVSARCEVCVVCAADRQSRLLNYRWSSWSLELTGVFGALRVWEKIKDRMNGGREKRDRLLFIWKLLEL